MFWLRRSAKVFLLCCLLLTGYLDPARADDHAKAAGDNWCATETYYLSQNRTGSLYKTMQECHIYGPCDTAAIRDQWIPDTTWPITYVRIVVHILAMDDGSYPATIDAIVDSNVAHLNEDFLPCRIQFGYSVDHVLSDWWRRGLTHELDAEMKLATAVKPDSQLNVWVTETTGYSRGTLPQLTELNWTNGVTLDVGWAWGSANSIFAHEVCHTLGLWHNFFGVLWPPPCGACHEPPNGEDNNQVGDLCHDTPASPGWNKCSNPPGTDSCSGEPWGYIMPENFMGYTPESCYTMFTPQQMGRMHCWLNYARYSYIAWVRFSAENTYGPTRTEVSFEGVSDVAADSWHWDFGDGETADVPSPVHTYQQPGVFDVTLTVQSGGQPYWWTKEAYVQIYDDTLTVDSVEYVTYEGESIRVDVYAANHIPLRELVIPFSWSGPVEMVFDSMSTAGLRTESFESASLIDFDSAGHQATISLVSSSNEYGPLMEPGDEAVVSLYFTITEATSGNYPIDIISYDTYSPQLVAYQGDYAPTSQAGSMNLSLSAQCRQGCPSKRPAP
jgi:PKD repeat protein